MKKTLFSILLTGLTAGLLAAQPQAPSIPEDPYYEVKELPCTNSFGKQLYGELCSPRNGLNRKPVIIMVHGFNGTHINFYDIIPEMAKDGFMCYTFDLMGGSSRSKSEGSTADMTIFTETQDIIDVVEMFRNMQGVDPDKIFLLGESQGGLVSAMAAARIPDKIRALGLMYPALGIPASADRIYPTRQVPDEINVMGMKLGGDFYRKLFDYDVFREIGRYKGPVIDLHGDADRLVDKSLSERAASIYKNCEFHIIEGGDHGFNDPEDRAECRAYLRRFFNDQLKTVEDQLACLTSPAHQLPLVPDEYKQPAAHQGEVVRLDYKTKGPDGQVLEKYTKVYLPYGYNPKDKKTRYNVFYLLHGGNGNPEHYWMWRNPSLKNIIDNMIERGELDPVIIVTPTYYPPGRTSGGTDDVRLFRDELVNVIMPLVEGQYHTYSKDGKAKSLIASRDHRAFGGFSLGSACTWWEFIQALDYFKWFMPMSGDCWALRTGGPMDPQATDTSMQTARFLADNLKNFPDYKDDFFIYAMTGDRDIAYEPMLRQMAALSKFPDFRFDDDFTKGNIYFSVMHGGFHSFEYINQYIYYALPYFFK